MTKKLLLADDSITIQKVIGIIFATEDYQLIICDDGDEAFAKALEEFPDLVIADIAMPGKDGFELCEAIKAETCLAHTSVLLLPGTFEHFDESRAEAVGADGWLSKPFESQALLDKVSQLLDAASAPLSFADEPVAEENDDEIVAEDIAVEEPAEEIVDLHNAAVDETILGLDEVEELEPLDVDEPVADDSADDIWDAVSFEEDELQPLEEDSAAVALDELVEEVEPAAETIPEPVIEDEPVEEEAPLELDEAAEEESDFSFTDDEAPLDLTEEVAVEQRLEETPGYAVEEEQLQEVAEESFAVEGIKEPAAMESIEEEVGDETSSFETEEVEQSEVATIAEAEELPVVEPLSEDMLEDDEEILDLAEDDILEEEVVEDLPVEELSAPEPAVVEEELEPEEEVFILEEDDVATEEGLLTDIAEEESIEDLVPEEIVADESMEEEFVLDSVEKEAVIEASEEEIVSVVEPVSEYVEESFVDEDDGESAEAVSLVQPAAILTTGFAADADKTTQVEQVEQVEQQLRELSEDELKEVVARVAGPTIEKLANEMLEQIVWEVVPDLAESMIREEIRKIRQGTE